MQRDVAGPSRAGGKAPPTSSRSEHYGLAEDRGAIEGQQVEWNVASSTFAYAQPRVNHG